MMQKSPSEHHRTTLSGYIFPTEACIDNRKKLVKQQYLLQMSLQYGELRPTNGWFGVPHHISTGIASWQRYCTALWYWASAKLCGVEQRAPPMFGRATITLGVLVYL